MPFDYAISAFLTLFVVVDPIGLTPTFLAVTDGLPRTARRLVAVRASIIAGIILAGSTLIRRIPHCRRLVVVFNRLGNGLWRSHSAGRRSRRASR
jgi:hypothetical protein